ncbi:MAG: hypothetical protein DRJ69_04995, partial [Thermoprotei archaeon]
MSRKIGVLVLVSLLILSTAAILATAVPVAAEGRTAWLKIVTSAWKGISCGDNDPDTDWDELGAIYDGVTGGFAGDQPDETTPMCPPPDGGFADRFNVTGLEAFVEVWSIKETGDIIGLQGTFEPNATGFVKISWAVEDTWGLLILVKAKSYYGEKIGAGSPFSGIIIYALLIPPRNPTAEGIEKIANITGVFTMDAPPWDDFLWWNFTVNDDGIVDVHLGDFNFEVAGPYGSGPFDYLNGTSVDLGNFSKMYGNETDAGTPVNAWIARAAKIFKVFHVHSWYDLKDNLSFAQVKIYDLDHTPASSESSLIQACVTAEDGQCRYTREIYPADALDYRDFWENNLVPIPLQIFNLENETVFHGGIADPHEPWPANAIGAPKLNATVRVWWETVIVNQTIYYGHRYNATGVGPEFVDLAPSLNKNMPLFWGPFSMAFNHTLTVSATTKDGFDVAIADGDGWDSPTDPDPDINITRIANFLNATVFYAKFCVQDADMKIQHPEVGDKLVEAPVSINLKTSGDRAYYLTKNLLTTDTGGCTNEPHKYRGYLSDYRTFARFPNATMWYALY